MKINSETKRWLTDALDLCIGAIVVSLIVLPLLLDQGEAQELGKGMLMAAVTGTITAITTKWLLVGLVLMIGRLLRGGHIAERQGEAWCEVIGLTLGISALAMTLIICYGT
jgi:hypothetical protein